MNCPYCGHDRGKRVRVPPYGKAWMCNGCGRYSDFRGGDGG